MALHLLKSQVQCYSFKKKVAPLRWSHIYHAEFNYQKYDTERCYLCACRYFRLFNFEWVRCKTKSKLSMYLTGKTCKIHIIRQWNSLVLPGNFEHWIYCQWPLKFLVFVSTAVLTKTRIFYGFWYQNSLVFPALSLLWLCPVKFLVGLVTLSFPG